MTVPVSLFISRSATGPSRRLTAAIYEREQPSDHIFLRFSKGGFQRSQLLLRKRQSRESQDMLATIGLEPIPGVILQNINLALGVPVDSFTDFSHKRLAYFLGGQFCLTHCGLAPVAPRSRYPISPVRSPNRRGFRSGAGSTQRTPVASRRPFHCALIAEYAMQAVCRTPSDARTPSLASAAEDRSDQNRRRN
jgi:hypothetical protein